MRPRRWSLRTQAALAIVLLVTVLTAVMTWHVGRVTGERMTREIGRTLADTSTQMADALDQTMWTRFRELRAVAAMPSMADPTENRASVAGTLEALQDAMPQFSWLGLLSAEGEVLESTDSILKGANISQRPVFQQAREGVFFGDVHDALLLAQHLPHPRGQPLQFVDIAFPLRGPGGALQGVLAAHLSWAWAAEVERDLLVPFSSRKGVSVFVVGKGGDILLGSTGGRGEQPDLAALDRAAEGDAGWLIETWPDGERYLTGYALASGAGDYAGLGWRILARQPVEEALAPVRSLQGDLAIVGLLLAVLFAGLGWLATGPITAPLRRIAATADLLRREHGGHGTAEAAGRSDVPRIRGSHEIESLALSLRALLDGLRTSRAALGAMEDTARRDPLTGLPNRRGMAVWLSEAHGRCQREENRGLAVLVLDLDGFKRANDTLGHAAGDDVLVQVARRLQGLSRANDLVARLGGDEFLMVLEVHGPPEFAGTSLVGERLIHAINRPIETEGGEVHVGCSVGVAFWPWDAETPDAALRVADEALYVAKAEGKNRVCHYSAIAGRSGTPTEPTASAGRP